MSYKNIKLTGTESYPRGEHTICIRKNSEDLVNRITYVGIKSC